MFEDVSLEQWLKKRALDLVSFVVLFMPIFLFISLSSVAPTIWAAVVLALFVLVSGMVTTRVVFNLKSPAQTFLLSPVVGLAWVGFFWCVFKLM